MPTIEVSLKTFGKLAGKTMTEKDLEIVKGEIEAVDKNRAKIEIGDTNRPDLWSVEGIVRAIKAYNGKKPGQLRVKNSGKKIIVDKKLAEIRPFIAGFIAKFVQVDEDLLLDLIQLQDKLAENYGKKRKKISVGIYNHDRIKFPVHYKAVDPSQAQFIPLEFEKPVTLKEVLEEHPKGKEYGYILHDHKLFPLFIDSKEEVLSFPPIINSNYIGKVEPGSQNLFIEVTGTDHKAVLLATNIFALALQDRGAKIESVVSSYPWKTKYGTNVSAPYIFNEKISFDRSRIKDALGIELNDKEIKSLMEKMLYGAKITGSKIIAAIPDYRNDVMHLNDVIEDIAIAYGYENFTDMDITSSTTGSLKERTLFSEKLRRIMIGAGFQELLSNILTSKKILCNQMMYDEDIIEIDNAMSENYSAVRNWLIPIMLQALQRNMHNEYPQKIFEFGECVVRNEQSNDYTKTVNRIGGAISDINIGYEQISSIVDALFSSLEISYELQPMDHNSFIKGRCAKIIIDSKFAGIAGEIHPQVLNNFGIEKAVVVFELDADLLYQVVKK
ncbi:MAG: phenylalanine--tRNA ligase subunit beta [Candidatus Aenigmarchaeota archaeon]|nr:phenylalanine--tRNA ligase subunit beta [Candidatus Aenigmarchaeota archaeon]